MYEGMKSGSNASRNEERRLFAVCAERTSLVRPVLLADGALLASILAKFGVHKLEAGALRLLGAFFLFHGWCSRLADGLPCNNDCRFDFFV